jgi:hypothetical protein
MGINLEKISGKEPLLDYPWRADVDRLLEWLTMQNDTMYPFYFDVIMSAAYIDATSGIEKSLEQCHSVPTPYNVHLGFVNICSPCYLNKEKWQYQKAVKPQSGALG